MLRSIDLQFRCSNCNFASLDVKATQIHLTLCEKSRNTAELENNAFECFVCDQSFKTERILSKHHLDDHDLSDGYEEANDLVNEVTNTKKFQPDANPQILNSQTCPVCKQTFAKERALLNHLLKDHIGCNFLPRFRCKRDDLD